MTAAILFRYAVLNQRCCCPFTDGRSREWFEVFTPYTVAALINEIDRLRVLRGEQPSYESRGTVEEAFREMLQDK